MTASNPVDTDRWYHIAVTYDGSYKMYIDGLLVATANGSPPAVNTRECILGAMDQSLNPSNKPVHYFTGWIDELRIWNVALEPEHIHQMMNQEIKKFGTSANGSVIGEVIDMPVKGPDFDQNGTDDVPIIWADLEGYYRMENISCGYLEPNFSKGYNGKIRNIITAEPQTAPLPYISVKDGVWNNITTAGTPWLYGYGVWDHPNSIGVNGEPIDWNIVVASHTIDSGNEDITLLGLIYDTANEELTISNPGGAQDETNSGHMLWITQYLLLDGYIDLIGESQLLEKK